MNSELPTIKVSKTQLTDKVVNDLNKLSIMLLEKNKNMAGGRRKKSKTRKIHKQKK